MLRSFHPRYAAMAQAMADGLPLLADGIRAAEITAQSSPQPESGAG